MKLGALFSGGKDSCFACYKSMREHEVVCLINLISENKESYMFHTPNILLAEKQAECIGLPIIIRKTKGEKEKELDDLKDAIKIAIKKYKIEGLVTGAVASVYQASRIQKICDELNLKCINPLWQKNQIELLKELIKNKFKVLIVGVFAYPFTEEWLGKEIDAKVINELEKLQEKYKINPAGEGGEIETFVYDAPFFRKRIEILDSEKIYKNYAGVFKIKKIRLIEK